jgi:hypothetical protein
MKRRGYTAKQIQDSQWRDKRAIELAEANANGIEHPNFPGRDIYGYEIPAHILAQRRLLNQAQQAPAQAVQMPAPPVPPMPPPAIAPIVNPVVQEGVRQPQIQGGGKPHYKPYDTTADDVWAAQVRGDMVAEAANRLAMLMNPPALPAPIAAIPPVAQLEVKEHKEAAEPLIANKALRKAYVPELGGWFDKKEIIDKIAENKQNKTNAFRAAQKAPQEMAALEKELARQEFSWLKQYNLSKHQPLDVKKYGDFYAGKFGFPGKDSSALTFYGTNATKGGQGIRGWKHMSPAEQDEFIRQENALKNTPERIAQKQAKKQAANQENQNREYKKIAEQQATRWKELSPAERQQQIYNKQLQDYTGEQQQYEYANQMNTINQNQQPQFVQEMGGQNTGVSPVMMNELMNYMESQPTRYVPIRPRRSINEKVMSSFDPNLFSPEFISEEY